MGTERCPTCASLLRGGACTRCSGTVARPDLLAPRASGPIGEFFAGLILAFRSIRLSLTRPALLSLVVLPLLLSIGSFIAMVWLVWTHREAFRPDFATEWHWTVDWLRGVIGAIAEFVYVVLALGVAVFVTLAVQTVLNAPFNEWLSEAAESLVLGARDRTPLSMHKVWNTWLVPIAQAAVLAVVSLFFALCFLLLSFTGVFAPLVFFGTAWLTAVSLVDVAIARKRAPVRERFKIVNKNLPLWLGLALPFAFVPFALPLGIVGATFAELRERVGTDR